LDETEEKLL